MTQKDIDKLLHTNSGRWDSQIAFSPKEIAEMLQLPLSTISKLCRDGTIRCFKIGRHYRITRSDLCDYIDLLKDNSLIL